MKNSLNSQEPDGAACSSRTTRKAVPEKIISILESGDFFLENPPLQPKQEIANYIESCGILVPRRFANLKEAHDFVKAGGYIIVRSEHPQEYNGVSWLLESYCIDQEILTHAEKVCAEHGWDITEKDKGYCRDIPKTLAQFWRMDQYDFETALFKLSEGSLECYYPLARISEEAFRKNTSYSYWEKLGGDNCSIVADSAIPGRYHLFMTGERAGKKYWAHSYAIIEKGAVIFEWADPLLEKQRASIHEMVAWYEKIRNLSRFNSSHCPIVEFQRVDDTNYFLQYHRTRDSEGATPSFTLDRPLEEDEIEANFVRWSTPEEWIILDASTFYPYFFVGEYVIDKTEQASFDHHANHIFTEIMSRTRTANIVIWTLDNIAHDSRNVHMPKSRLFKPRVSVAMSDTEGRVHKSGDGLFEKKLQGEVVTTRKIKIRLISDGKRAYVKFL